MADISSYPQATPTGDDLILGSQADEAGVHHTKTFTTQSVADLGSGGGGGGNYTSSNVDETITAEWTFTGDLTINGAELYVKSDSPKVKYIGTSIGNDIFFEETVGVTNNTAIARRQVWDNIAGRGIKTTFNALAAGGTSHWQYQNDFAWSVNDTEEVLRIRGDVNGTGKVGIKTTNPQAELDVNGEIRSSGNLRIAKTFPSLELQELSGTSSNSRSIKFLSGSGAESGSIRHQSGPDGGGDPGITTGFYPTSIIKSYFNVGQSSFVWKMYESGTSAVETAMKVAVKNSSASRLTLYGGDVELDEASSGVILKSPNGTRYKLTVDNAGSLAVTAV